MNITYIQKLRILILILKIYLNNVNDIDNINDMIFDQDIVSSIIMMNFILFDVWGGEKLKQ